MVDRYDYAGHFRGIRDQERLVLSAQEITWQEKYERPTRPVDVLVYLGCHVMITGHLAIELTAVLDKLGVEVNLFRVGAYKSAAEVGV